MTTSSKYKKVDDFRGHIVHLEKLTPDRLVQFLETWNNNFSDITITEKMDGMFLSFGVDNAGFYVGSKNTKKRSLDSINPNIYYLEPLRKAFAYLASQDFKSILGYKETFAISCEWIPCHNYNIIPYDEKVVQDGLFVVYTVKVDEVDIVPEEWVEKLNKGTNSEENKIHFVLNPTVEVPHTFKFNPGMIEAIKNSKTKPDQQREASETSKDFKSFFIKCMEGYKSQFGYVNKWEGVVFHTPNGRVKITTPAFVKIKDRNWNPLGVIDHEIKQYVAEQSRQANRPYQNLSFLGMKSNRQMFADRIKALRNGLNEKKYYYDRQTDLLPKKKEDLFKYIELKKDKLHILECLIITSPDMDAIRIAFKLFLKDKLDV